ncbi:MAG: hypothetical protein GAK30_01750 [Paracidovorax wautersii]|uniref:DUF1294 domain-containing protein n=1 Tax=Paracidovorax wautersii TaxID=1177982 RepID=A0A7V8FP84_9BURK|nr:MAG: hypothetical protein GAK30_01750 [Paracidovorax wautersii]
MHARDFGPQTTQPQAGMVVSFEVEASAKGPRAVRVQIQADRGRSHGRQNQPAARPSSRRTWPAQARSTARLGAIVLFLLLYLGVAWLWPVSNAVLLLYLGASAVCYGAYALDKRAAQRGSWRIAEKTLHGLALIGGWPGALLAQHYLRHKSSKASFQALFWLTVVINVAAFVLLASPYGEPLARHARPLLRAVLNAL